MKSTADPLEIPPAVAAKCAGPNQGENFDRTVRQVLSVSKTDLDRYERGLQAQRKAKRAQRGKG